MRDEWYVWQSRLGDPLPEDTSPWTFDKSSPQVWIPLFKYVLSADDGASILIKLGAQVSALALSYLPEDKDVGQFLIVISEVFARSDGKSGYECWIGFAFQVLT